MNFKILILFSITTLLISCSKKVNPTYGYNEIKTKKSITIGKILKANSQSLIVKKEVHSSLKLTDSILVYNDTVFSNYKQFTFKFKPQKTYKIKVSSLCNCFGFKKYIFNPEIYILNNENREIKGKLDSIFFDYKFGPLALNKVWELKSDHEINTSFLVFSNNQNLSKDIYNFIAKNYNVIPLALPIRIKETLVGDFVITIEEK